MVLQPEALGAPQQDAGGQTVAAEQVELRVGEESALRPLPLADSDASLAV